MQQIWDNTDAMNKAFYNQNPDILHDLLDKLSRCCLSCSPTDKLDVEIDKMRQFADARLTDICLCIYDEPEKSIRLIGEKVIPAVHEFLSAALKPQHRRHPHQPQSDEDVADLDGQLGRTESLHGIGDVPEFFRIVADDHGQADVLADIEQGTDER